MFFDVVIQRRDLMPTPMPIIERVIKEPYRRRTALLLQFVLDGYGLRQGSLIELLPFRLRRSSANDHDISISA